MQPLIVLAQSAMNSFHEKIFFGTVTLIGTSFSMLGAILSVGETRWLYVTLAASFMTSGFLALMFKRQEETIRLVVGRCGLAILGGVLATKPAVHWLEVAEAELDVIALAGVSSGVTVLTFFVGFALLTLLEKNAPVLAEKWFKKFTE